MRWIGTVLLSTVALAGCAGINDSNSNLWALIERSAQSQPKLTAYEQGKRYLALNSPSLAIAEFQRELAQHPDSVPALNGMAVAYDRLGRRDVTEELLKRALALDPNSAVSLNNLSYLSLAQGKVDLALSYGRQAQAAIASGSSAAINETIANALANNVKIAQQLAELSGNKAAVANLPGTVAENAEINSSETSTTQVDARSDGSLQKAGGQHSVASTSAPLSSETVPGAAWEMLVPNHTVLRVSNGTGRNQMAARFADYLESHQLQVGMVTNANSFTYSRSAIFYNPGEEEFAAQLAHTLPFPTRLIEAKRGRGQVEVILGNDSLTFDDRLRST